MDRPRAGSPIIRTPFMSLLPGARVSVYEIVAKVGEGGMGEVYRGRDTKLARDVALKVIPDAFAHDAERLARFEREARTLASLNHSHIAQVYGFEQSGGVNVLVMEFVDGEDLAERIRRGAIPLDDAIPIARQIAEALEAAHEAGIVHRDLKPANIKIKEDGTVKVLDFGLAKAFDPASAISHPSSGSVSDSPTITSPAMTMRGVILGTAAYMAPEQAKGKYVDKRADIWAFGCVLYEMLTGKRAFDGEDVSDTLASVLRADPDFAALAKRSNPALAQIVKRCLVRDPRQRIRDIGDVRIRLDDEQSREPVTSPSRRSRGAAVVSAGLVVVALLAVGVPLVLWTRSTPTRPPQLLRFSLSLPDGYRIHRLASGRYSFAVSPDGEKVAAVLRPAAMGQRVYVRRLDDTEFREVPGTDGAQGLVWAPDSDRFAFSTPQGIKFSSLSGVNSLPAVVLPGYGAMVWGSDDRMVAGVGAPLPMYRWQAGGQGVPDPPNPDGVILRQPFDRFGNRALLVAEMRTVGTTSEVLVVAQSDDGGVRELTRIDTPTPALTTSLIRSGHLLIARVERSGRSILTAQPFDTATMTLSGHPATLVEDLNQTVSASDTGVLAFGPRNESAEDLVWVNARGELISRVMSKLQAQNFDVSRDDRFVVLQAPKALRVHDLQRGVTSMVTSRGVDPIWSADGRQIAFSVVAAGERGIYVMPAFGGAERRVYTSAVPTFIDDWSSDGKWLSAHTNRVNTTDQKGEGFLIPLDPGAKPIVFGDTTAARGVDEGRFAPDGRWLAFGLSSADAGDVFLMPLPPTGERWQVSVSGGAQPRWSSDGKTLFFLATDGRLMAVDVEARPGAPPAISAPRALFQTGLSVTLNLDQFAVSRDGQRFLIRRPEEAVAKDEIRIIVNWPELLKTK